MRKPNTPRPRFIMRRLRSFRNYHWFVSAAIKKVGLVCMAMSQDFYEKKSNTTARIIKRKEARGVYIKRHPDHPTIHTRIPIHPCLSRIRHPARARCDCVPHDPPPNQESTCSVLPLLLLAGAAAYWYTIAHRLSEIGIQRTHTKDTWCQIR